MPSSNRRFIRLALSFILGAVVTTAATFAQGTADRGTSSDVSSSTTTDSVAASSENSDEADDDAALLPAMTVLGAFDSLADLPGSGEQIDLFDLRYETHADVNRVLRQTPGVYLREEDGFGLFPNISLRGVDTTRSAKVTIMEDGILSAPAPYSAPSAYYSPTLGRMHSIEVLKGSSQIRFGPHITGGVINYVSTPIPDELSGFVKAVYGSDNEIRIHAWVGDTFDTSIGRFGFLLEGFLRTSDGFKEIDETPDFQGGDETGFTKTEPLLKLSFEPKSSIYQRFEVKVGYTDLDSDETYLGLTDSDFADDPFRRYAGSRFDEFKSHHLRTSFDWHIEVNENVQNTVTVYYNKFRRNWYKLHDVADVATTDFSTYSANDISLSRAIAEGGSDLAVLRGEAEGTLRVRNNNRSYYLWGVQNQTTFKFDTGSLKHTFTLGLRYHQDRVRRFQTDELFAQAANGTIFDTNPGTPGNAGNRRQQTTSLAVFLQDSIEIGDVTVTPGIRFEQLWQDHDDFDNPARTGENDLSLLAGGIGATWKVNDELTVFGGVHRGFSPPSPRAAVVNDLEEETSISAELGARFQDSKGRFAAEATAFYSRFDDLIVIDNVGGTGTGESENVGEAQSFGIELSAEVDPGTIFDWGVRAPVWLTFTYTDATLESNSDSEDEESIFSGARRGNRIPYIPEFGLTFGAGLETEEGGINVTFTYIDEVFTSGNNTSRAFNAAGDPDARFGKTDDVLLVDINGRWNLNENLALFGGVHNLLDEEYVVSRHPHGPRPGRGTFGFVGVELSF